MDVVSFGNSIIDKNSYYLIRAYDDPEHLKTSQDAFYSSDAWREGPRSAIIERIETSVKSVMIRHVGAVEALRD